MTETRNEPDLERSPVAAVARLFAVQIAAVIGIAAAITVVVVLVGPESTDVQAGLPATSSAPETGSPSTPSPTASAGTKPSRRASTTSATPPPPDTPSATESTPGAGSRGPKVDVLNQSAGDGAGEQTADLLRDAGWRIGRVADFSGTVRTTTVYYLDDDLRRDARAVARDLPGEVRVLEGFSTLSATRLSVVLVD